MTKCLVSRNYQIFMLSRSLQEEPERNTNTFSKPLKLPKQDISIISEAPSNTIECECYKT